MRNVLTGRRLATEDEAPAVTRCFRREPQSVPEARRFARAAVEEWQLPKLADTAELAANAVCHACHGAFRVTLRLLSADQVQVAVIDRS